MVCFLACVKKTKKCRFINVFLFCVIVMICMIFLQTPQKTSHASLKQMEYVLKYDLKLLMANISIQVSHPNNSSLKYLLNTSKCKLPNLEVFNSDVLPFYERHPYHRCSNKPLLTYVTKENNIGTLHINYRHVIYYGDSVTCCYADVIRPSDVKEPDVDVVIAKCKPFVGSIILKEDVVYVSCMDQDYKNVYKNVHAVVTINEKIYQKIIKQNQEKTKAFSILFIGLDSVSRLNLQRSFPKTSNFVQKNDWLEFKAYNKVGLNTFPNLMAILTGKNETESFSQCKPRSVGGLNSCNFIWNDYCNLDYITAYAEDEPNINTFNYLKKGFVEKPVDYYFRPYFMAADKCLERFEIDGLSYCMGPESSGERVLKLAEEFTTTFCNNSYFGFFWMNSFTHNNFNTGTRMDKKVLEFFENLNKTAIFDNTIVIFLSDHGFRFGAYLHTHSGWFEERLPFFYMYLPERFKRTFPIHYSNLLENTNKLSSPYDLYMTLQDILTLSRGYTIKPSSGCPKCKSLLQNMHSDRSCKDAGIDSEWCSCNNYFTISQKSLVIKEAVKFLLNDVHNVILNGGSDFEQCSQFNLSKVLSARVSEGEGDELNINYILVTFEVEPQAVLQGTLSINMATKRPSFKLEGSVRRVDYYGDHSWCTSDATIKPYCYCQDKVTLFLRLLKIVGKQISQFFTGA